MNGFPDIFGSNPSIINMRYIKMFLWYPGALIYNKYWTELIIMSFRLYSLSLSFSELIEFLHGVSKERTSLDRRSTIEQEGPESWYIQRPRPDIYSDHALVSISMFNLGQPKVSTRTRSLFHRFIFYFFFIFDVSFFLSCNLINYGSSFFSAIHTKIWQIFIIFHILSQTNKISFTLDKCLLLMRFRLTFLYKWNIWKHAFILSLNCI